MVTKASCVRMWLGIVVKGGRGNEGFTLKNEIKKLNLRLAMARFFTVAIVVTIAI